MPELLQTIGMAIEKIRAVVHIFEGCLEAIHPVRTILTAVADPTPLWTSTFRGMVEVVSECKHLLGIDLTGDGAVAGRNERRGNSLQPQLVIG